MALHVGILELVKHLGINRTQLAEEIGSTPSTINTIIRKKQESSPKVESQIIDRYPNINIAYVRYQVGNMVAQDSQLISIGKNTYGLDLENINNELAEPIPVYSAKDKIYNVENDAMVPIYQVHDRIIASQLSSKIDIKQNDIYIVSTKDLGVLVRRVTFLSEDMIFVLTPENKKYETVKLPATHIISLWLPKTICKSL